MTISQLRLDPLLPAHAYIEWTNHHVPCRHKTHVNLNLDQKSSCMWVCGDMAHHEWFTHGEHAMEDLDSSQSSYILWI